MTDRSSEALSCHCEDGALTVTVDTQMLQVTNRHCNIIAY